MKAVTQYRENKTEPVTCVELSDSKAAALYFFVFCFLELGTLELYVYHTNNNTTSAGAAKRDSFMLHK